MRAWCFGLLASVVMGVVPVYGDELKGPLRFCGYSPIIDLQRDETIQLLSGGIHGGSFRWSGPFGSLEVHGIGWASRPQGRIVKKLSGDTPARFAPRRQDGRYKIAIWNGGHSAAYFISDRPISDEQIRAIDRVRLYEEGQNPVGCDTRTVFSWE
jgi:hypothetical protein